MSGSRGSSTKRGSAQGQQRRETRREQIEQRRLEREREQAQQAHNQRLRRGGLIGGGVLVVGLIAWAIVSAISSANARSVTIPGVVTYANLARNHVQGQVAYPQNPPVGGNHNPVWLNCGIYITPVPNENAVHSLEHGAVWITYRPDLADKSVTQLQNVVRGHSYVILSPYPGLPAPVVASAWGVQLKMQRASDSRLGQFITKYEQGPQTPEPGAPCSGGTGTPIG